MNAETIFYTLASIAALLFIIGLIQDSNEDEEVRRNVVVVPAYARDYGLPYWYRFRRNLPWYGPRPGRPFRRRHHGWP